MKRLLLGIILGLFLISMVSALESLGTFKQNQIVRVTQVCSDATYINISSISYPNSTVAVSGIEMTSAGSGEYYYNFSNANYSGRYDVRGISDGCEETFATYFDVNPQGIQASDQRTQTITRSIYFILSIAILLFIAFLFTNSSVPMKWTFFGISIIFFLIGINVVFVSLQDEVVNPKLEAFFSSFTAVSWYIYWFVGGILILMWFFTFFNTWLLKKNESAIRRYG